MKNTIRIIASVLLIAVIAASFAACGKKPAPAKDYDINAIAETIHKEVPFEDPYLALVENREFALSTYGVDPALVADENGQKACSIFVSGAYPEMIVAIKAKDESSAAKVMDSVKALIETYIKNYTTYTPEQVAKLESAVTETRGAYVFAIVSNDNSAAANCLKGLLG